jgi:hypothetical protein
MIGVQERHASEGLAVVTVNVDTKRSEADAFLEKQPGKLRVVYDPKGRLAEKYALKGMPASFLYDRRGVLRETHVGFKTSDAAALERTIAALLAEARDEGTPPPEGDR